MSIWTNLRKAKTSAELVEQRDQLASTTATHEAELQRLQATLRTGYREPNFDPKSIGADIRGAEDELTALRGVLAGVEADLAGAIAKEAAAALEARAQVAKGLQRDLRDTYVQVHEAATAFAAAVAKVRDLQGPIEEINAACRGAGRIDLVVEDPIHVLRRKEMRQTVDVLSLASIPEYYPQRHPTGPLLAGMKTLKL